MDYFAGLVAKENATIPEERFQTEKHLLLTMKKFVTKGMAAAPAEVLSKWYLLPLREWV